VALCGDVGRDSEEQRGEPLFWVALRPFADSDVEIVPLMFEAYFSRTNHNPPSRARLSSLVTAIP